MTLEKAGNYAALGVMLYWGVDTETPWLARFVCLAFVALLLSLKIRKE